MILKTYPCHALVMRLFFRKTPNGQGYLEFCGVPLVPGACLEVRLAERRWVMVRFRDWTGHQKEEPSFEITLPGSKLSAEIRLPVYADYRRPPT